MAESNATLLGLAAQERRRLGGRRQALAVLRWRQTLPKGGAHGRPTPVQMAAADRIEATW